MFEESNSPDTATNKKDKLLEDATMDTTSANIIRYIDTFIDPVNKLVNKVSSVQSTDSSCTSSGRIYRKPQNFNTNIYEKRKCLLRIRTFLKNPSPMLILLPIMIFRIFPLQKMMLRKRNPYKNPQRFIIVNLRQKILLIPLRKLITKDRLLLRLQSAQKKLVLYQKNRCSNRY